MRIRLLVCLCFIVATIAAAQSDDHTTQSAQSDGRSKVAPWVVEHTQDGKLAEFLIVLKDQADLSGAALLKTKREKGQFVYSALWKKANETQGALLSWLESGNIEHRSYYIVNMISVRANLDVALSLAARAEVEHVEGNPVIKNDVVQPITSDQQSPRELLTIEGNITNTRAPEAWGLGYRGQGIVVGGADTGYRWDHVTLKPHYRGWDGTTANHDFNWHDSVHSGGGNCGANSPEPCDDYGHGTHTMGTVVGDDGAGNQVGMAPLAQWIGCRNMNEGDGTPASYIECMEFFLAPYPVNGTPAQGNPDKAPDITTNSWTCPPSEGCAPATIQQAVEAQRAAGIMMVAAAGNSGPSCSTVIDPPAIYDAAYSVGAFDHRTNVIAGFSSRGPVTIDGSNRIKPDLSAPGVSIRSAWNSSTSAFVTISGTSMATPHVAGAVALLWSAQPALRGGVSFTEQILNNSAVHVSSTSCSSNGVPNNTYGYGRLDIKTAVDAALPCTNAPALSASSGFFLYDGGPGSVNVTSVAGCGWIAETNANWITITSGSAGSGSGSVSYTVAPNFTANSRTGTLIIAGQTFNVTQTIETADTDADGIPDGVEFSEGTNPQVRDNAIFNNARLFAMQQYRDFLGREGDPGGISFWTNQINSGSLTRAQVIDSFFNSTEFQGTVSPVTRLYFAYFLRIPDYGGLLFWVNQYRNGASLDTISQFFAQSPEFIATYGSLSNADFVTLLYNNVLGRQPDPGGLAFWVGQLNSGAMTRGQVMLGFSESPEYKQTSFNKVYVTMIYVGMLRRAPEQGGFDFWVNQLNGGASGLNLIQGFLTAPEYHNRFLP